MKTKKKTTLEVIPKLRSEKLSQAITATREPIFRGTSIQNICGCAGELTLLPWPLDNSSLIHSGCTTTI